MHVVLAALVAFALNAHDLSAAGVGGAAAVERSEPPPEPDDVGAERELRDGQAPRPRRRHGKSTTVMRREQQADHLDGSLAENATKWPLNGSRHAHGLQHVVPEWLLKMSRYNGGYGLNYRTSKGFDWADFLPDEDRRIQPLAQRCYDGGHSGGHFFDYQLFAHGIQPMPPMTVIARIKTIARGRNQTFLGWKPIRDGDPSKSEFMLTEDGNLMYLLHDGFKLWSVKAVPAVDLTDGVDHVVALVREGNQTSIGVASLYCDGYQVGEGYIDGWPSHLQPWASSLQVDLDPGQEQFRGFEGDVGNVRIFDEALSPSLVKRVGHETCTITVRPAQWVHSNLGGMGPDSGEQALRFLNAATFRQQPLDMLIVNLTDYTPKFPERNGVATDSVARINLMANRPVRLSFRFVKPNTNEDVAVDAFTLSFFHAEQGIHSGSQEIFTFESMVDEYFVTNKTSEVFVTGSDLDASLTFRSELHSPNRPHPPEITNPMDLNPEDTDHLSLSQSEASFGVRIVRSAGLHMTMTLVGEEGHARDILFGGASSIFKTGIANVPI